MGNKVKQSSKNKEENLLNEDRKAFNKRLKRYASRISSGYTEESLEEERRNLCLSQGLSRRC
jgi:hypothetical protein